MYFIVIQRDSIQGNPKQLLKACCGDSLSTIVNNVVMCQDVSVVKITNEYLETEEWMEDYATRVRTIQRSENNCIRNNAAQLQMLFDFADAWKGEQNRIEE